jgi:hypothetical protein
MTSSGRSVLGVAFLALQAALMVRAHLAGDRYFCWAPHDMQTEYFISATLNGRPLDDAAIRARYLLASHGWDSHHWRHVVDAVQLRERRALPGEQARVELRYRVNGRPPGTAGSPTGCRRYCSRVSSAGSRSASSSASR